MATKRPPPPATRMLLLLSQKLITLELRRKEIEAEIAATKQAIKVIKETTT